MLKNNYIIGNVKIVFSNKIIQIFSIVSLLIIGYFASTIDRESDYFVSISSTLTYQQFITLCFLPMLFFTDLQIINLYDNNSMLIIRFKNKKRYIKEMIKNVLCCNNFTFLVLLLTIFTFFNFFGNGDFSVKYIEQYGTTNIIFAFYTIIKLYILSNMVSIIFTLIIKLTNKLCYTLMFICISASLYICQWVSYDVVSSIFKSPYYFGFYFLSNVKFISFKLNLLSFFIICLVQFFTIIFLYKLTVKKSRVVGN